METTVLNVDGMSCEHCVKAVKDALEALPGVIGVEVDLEIGTVTVEHDSIQSPPEQIANEIEDQGYDVISSVL